MIATGSESSDIFTESGNTTRLPQLVKIMLPG